MEYIMSANEMKFADNFTSEVLGVPSLVLMEKAALSVFEEVKSRFPDPVRVLLLCGSGNNGGDGLAVGRLLAEAGYMVEFVYLKSGGVESAETRKQYEIIRNYGLPVWEDIPENKYTIIIDGMFGIGLNREVEGGYKQLIEKINQSKAYKIAIDIPSGIHSDTGHVMGIACRVDLTITFEYKKRGLLLFPGSDYSGEVVCKPIGISKKSLDEQIPHMQAMTGLDLLPSLPKRMANANKGTFGKVLLIAGSKDMCGAAVLAAKSSYRSGAGMVKIITPVENRIIVQEMIPEALLSTYVSSDSWEDFDKILQTDMQWADVIAIGPGMGVGEFSSSLLNCVLESGKLPLVIDADGINLLQLHSDLFEKAISYANNYGIVITPHVGECARLLQIPVKELQNSLVEKVEEFAEKTGMVLVCKDWRTIISNCGKELYINLSGNNGMATAGSGDVLTGIIAGLVAQRLILERAAVLGTYVHGMAGDLGVREKNQYSLMAGDIIKQLDYILKN